MVDYDFSTLNDKEFENLTIELISKERTQRYERFKSGRDGGIDGRFYHSNGTQEIIQCKHYQKTGFNGLISSLKKKSDKGINEIDKVTTLNPTKYIFITSIQLSADNKEIIKELFSPYIINDNDIYGQEDLNQILGTNPDIEKRYYKLWLSSTVVLDRIFNNAIESRSEFLLEDIKENAKYYVVTDNHLKAIEKLENSHVIIISGEPGIGKTTLAEHIALWYVEKDFKFYNIENAISEAERIYKRNENQIFYFDDFLGANYLNAIADKKDSHISKFIDRIKKDKTKRFILTSRTNILNQGLSLSDTFKSKNIENEEFIIKIDSLKDSDKAWILYNHIWHSDLDEEFQDEIYSKSRYKQIIYHKNFNPRLIEFITDIKKIKIEKIEANKYWKYILEKLDNPQDIWKNTFDKQSDEFVRIIVMLTVFNGNTIEENELRKAYYKYINLSGLENDSHTSKEFDSIIEEVVKYFLNRNKNYNEIVEYSLFNPSIADFVLNKYGKYRDKLLNIYLTLNSVTSLKNFREIFFTKKVIENTYNYVLINLYQKVNIEKEDIDYIIQLMCMIEVNYSLFTYDRDKIYLFFQNSINQPKKIKLKDEYITTIFFIDKKKLNMTNEKFKNLFLNSSYFYLDIYKILELIYYFDINDNLINSLVNEHLELFLIDELNESLEDLNYSDYSIQVSKDGGIYSNYIEIKEKSEELLSDLIDSIQLLDGLNIDKEKILNSIDIESHNSKLVNDYYENEIVEQSHYPEDPSETSSINKVENIFER